MASATTANATASKPSLKPGEDISPTPQPCFVTSYGAHSGYLSLVNRTGALLDRWAYALRVIFPFGSTVMVSSCLGLKGNCESLAMLEGIWMRNLSYSFALPRLPLIFVFDTNSFVVPFRTISTAMTQLQYKQSIEGPCEQCQRDGYDHGDPTLPMNQKTGNGLFRGLATINAPMIQ